MPAVFVPNPAGLAELLYSPVGPVARDLALRAVKVTSGAKRRAPVDTGRLRSSIRFAMLRDGKGMYARVGTEVEYALAVHEGHGAFSVTSKRGPGTALRFVVDGNTVFVSFPNSVDIPASRPRPFLRDALEDIGGI